MIIAAWSGPRNLSTAMMYAFGARADCQVWDEPLYAAYLSATGFEHPMRAEIIAAGEVDPQKVINRCTIFPSHSAPVFYQKHMAQHMIGGFDRDWTRQCTNIFLIRDPARVIASYAAKRENPTLDDIGFCQQTELFDRVCQQTGSAPPVLDSVDIRADPERSLRKLCAMIGLEFDRHMLNWPLGGHASDGVWARHWYGAVRQSTGFADPEGPLPEVAENLKSVWSAAMPFYQRLRQHKI